MVALKTRRKRRSAKSHRRKANRGRRSRRNPAVTLRRPIGALTAGFKPAALTDAAMIAGGVLANYWARPKVAAMLPATFQSGPASYLVGLTTAGAMLFVPKIGGKLFAGAVLEEVLRGIQEYVPQIKTSLLGYDDEGDIGLMGYGDYLEGAGDYLEGAGDYLTPAEGTEESLDDATL